MENHINNVVTQTEDELDNEDMLNPQDAALNLSKSDWYLKKYIIPVFLDRSPS